MKPVLVVGDACVDLSVRLPARSGNREQPPPPELALGGTAANTAVALARLGVATALGGAVGDDGYGRFTRAELAAAGVGADHLVVHPEAFTAMVLAIVDTAGERTLYAWPRRGAAHSQLRPEAIDETVIAGAAWLHTGGMCLVEPQTRDAVLRAMALAGAAGVPVSFDLNLRIGFRDGRFEPGFLDTIEQAIGLADHVLGSAEDELAHLGASWEHAARRIASAATSPGRPTRTVVARLGAEGVRAFTRDGVVAAPAVAVPVVSTLGAGDAFDAGYVAALVEGQPLAEALRRGNATAARKIAGLPLQ